MSSLPTHSKGQPLPIINQNNLTLQINKGLFQKYTISEKLYEIKDGSTKVFKAYCKQAQYPLVAIKSIYLAEPYFIENQIKCLKLVQSDYFINYIGLDINQKGQYGIFFPYIENYDIVRCYNLTQKTIRNYMRQLLQALEFAHSKGIIHRDIKPMNILYDRKSEILKVTDLGLATYLQKDYHYKLVGTTYYMAPQILLQSTNYNEKVDIWSAGIIFGQLIFGKSFFVRNQSDFFQQILQLLGSQECKDYIQKNDLNIYVLNEFQSVQYGKKNIKQIAKEISQKQKIFYSEQAIDLLSHMLILDLSQRISAAQALKHKFFLQQNK